MFNKIESMFRIPELKRRILYTIGMLLVYRLGGHITTPGIDGGALSDWFAQNQAGGLFGLFDLFAGGNFSRATIFALGIMPYISASIILQLFGAVIPYFERLRKEGEAGRKKITQFTRYGTVLLALIQSYGISIYMLNMAGQIPGLISMNPFAFQMLTMLSLTAGTVFVMWLGEQITERGIGNGISLVIFIGIVAQFPLELLQTWRLVRAGDINLLFLIILILGMVAVTAVVVMFTQAQRKIPVQYPKRVIGRKMVGGTSTHIPLRPNTAGVIPIIFAQSIIVFPSTLGSFFSDSAIVMKLNEIFNPGQPLYMIIYALMIIFFAYFYTAIVLNPVDLAENMKKYGGFVPGIRQGKPTANYIDRILTRITFPGAIYLAAIAVLPDILIYRANMPFYFGGTSLLIVVGVALDTLQQIEGHLLVRHYDGFLKRTRLRGGRRM
ncbi:MAG: preprotein translocase subunit SecY [Candidatus Eisenbacteria bacterium]|uniref:Protein translocase subunit SecY n=1 Tax=Eiseniibacteriota bacterium TaxID=2212470 RepID=A0A938BQU3_UNCEI|nr:preprotein translocase subunit SecY [Candidatus Eisenbacteria bacterium]